MGIKDIFHASQIREENERLKQILTPEMQDTVKLQTLISELEKMFQDCNQSYRINKTNCKKFKRISAKSVHN